MSHKFALILFTVLPLPAAAHPGHIATVAGHNHWVAGVAIGAAVAVAVWGLLKGRKDKETSDGTEANPEDATEEAQEA